MNSPRYFIVRSVVGLVLIASLIPLWTLVIGWLDMILPAGFAVFVGIIALLSAVTFVSRPIAEKLNKR